jgi:hypothetical protein
LKVVFASANPDSIGLHRAEARALGLLPDDLPVARLLDQVDMGDWIALVLEDIDGDQPSWAGDELSRVLDAVMALRTPLDPLIASQLAPITDAVTDSLAGWAHLKPGDWLPYDDELNTWIWKALDQLVALAAEGVRRCAGTCLVHGDLRADNVLIRREDKAVIVVDWPWASTGSPWFDPLCLLVDVLYRTPDCDINLVLATHPVFAGMPDGTAVAVMAVLAGYCTDQARRPEPNSLPGLRAFQSAQGRTALTWLRTRI